jgi:hypothetical protein
MNLRPILFAALALTAAVASAQTPRLVNLATRAPAGTGNDVLTAGFVISPGANKTVLIRAIGPTLAAYGLTGTLADPVLSLINAAGATVASNDNWLIADATTMSSVGAFTLATGSRDAALVATLAPGAYTAQVTGADATSTGLALVEVYEVSAGTSTLLNLSTRANIGTDANVAIPGLVISAGSAPRRLLIRAVGPTLSTFSLTGVLADPTLTVTNSTGTATFASNDNWGTPTGLGPAAATTLFNAFTAAGAFGLTAGSRDAAVLTELSAGNYTIQVSGVASTTGLALVEVYDVTDATISTAATAPSISTQPAPLSVAVGATATLSVTATGSNPLTYQWLRGTTAIGGATNASYTLTSVAASDAGNYAVTITNSAGSVTTNAATVSVTTSSTGPSTAAAVSAAQAFLATLSTTQQSTAQLAYTLAAARRWSNLPASSNFVARNGLAWGALTAAQKAAATTLLSSVLSPAGLSLLTGLQAADDYLGANGGGTTSYSSGLYFLGIYGTPSTTGFWVLQFTGHHLTQHFTFNGTYPSGTPMFLGVEPRTTFTLNGATYDPMVAQRTAAADLFSSLTTYPASLLSGTYTDILFGANGTGNIDGTYPKAYPTATTGRGILYPALAAADQEKVKTLLRAYVNTQTTAVATDLLGAYLSDTALASTYVAYAGPANVATSNSYLRVDGPRVWIELSVQGGIIIRNEPHYHGIWRDKLADYGGNF